MRGVSAHLRVAVYARVSTADQVEGTSLRSQLARCAAAASDAAWIVRGEFVDEGVSGALSSRPALDQVVRLVEDGEIEAVVVTKLDRVARSLRHLLDLLDLLERSGVQLIALDDPLDPSTASGRAMVHLRGVFAELERQLIRERTTEGLRRRVEEGGWPGGPAPYGYNVIANPGGSGKVLGINEDEAAIIRLAYKLIAEDGLTTGDAANQLHLLGTRPRRASEWTHWNLRRLLVDARGLSGSWPWRRSGRAGRTTGDEIAVSVPPILSDLEHERLLASLRATSTQPTGIRPYLLRTRISSPHGSTMQGVPGHAGSRWYRCAHRHSQRQRDLVPCDCRRLHAASIEEAVWSQVVQFLGDPRALEALASDRETDRGAHAALERDRLAQLESDMSKLEDSIAEEYSALRDDGFDPAAARAAIRGRNDRLVSLRDERSMLLRLRGKNLASAGTANRLRTLATQAKENLEDADDELRRRIIELLDLRVQVLGWDICPTCKGKGLVAVDHAVQQLGNTGAACPDCLRTRYLPVVRMAGQVPELLLIALADGSNLTEVSRGGDVVPFESELRIA